MVMNMKKFITKRCLWVLVKKLKLKTFGLKLLNLKLKLEFLTYVLKIMLTKRPTIKI